MPARPPGSRPLPSCGYEVTFDGRAGRRAPAAPLRLGHSSPSATTLPGLRMLSGSIAALIARRTAPMATLAAGRTSPGRTGSSGLDQVWISNQRFRWQHPPELLDHLVHTR